MGNTVCQITVLSLYVAASHSPQENGLKGKKIFFVTLVLWVWEIQGKKKLVLRHANESGLSHCIYCNR